MRLIAPLAAALLITLVFITGCQRKDEPEQKEPKMAAPSEEAPPSQEGPQPPAPPVFETFDGSPQLTLFARLGDYRPENSDEKGLSFWRTYQEHLLKTSGVATQGDSDNRAYAFRSIRGLDSVGFFSPLAAEPETAYRVSFKVRADLPEDASAGVGILEYDDFLWVGEQYPKSFDEKHRSGQHAGISITGIHNWSEQHFTFTTGPDTGMIHLIFHRDGTAAREPVFFDDIRIEKTNPQ